MKALKIGSLSITVPIIQGGMGVGVSLSGLAASVANEGGVGVISSAGLGLLYKDFSENFLEASILALKEEIRKAREKTLGVIGVNVLVAMTNFADMIKTSIALINALKGNFENGFAFAGSNAFRATKISSVKEIFQSLLKEYKERKEPDN